MLEEEARWLGRALSAIDASAAFPLLDAGSSTEHFRAVEQPWIDQLIWKPLRSRGLQVVHVDRREDPGVDLVGDFMDPGFAQELKRRSFRGVFCSNLLEHVVDRSAVARALLSVVGEGGYVFASCPFRYPYHADPIDTGFRPTPAELAAVFPECELLEGATVTCGSYARYVTRSPALLAKTLVRPLVPFVKPRKWWTAVCHLPWLFTPFEATCVVLRKGRRP